MEDDRIWIYAAMIVIYFIAWVLKRIKGLAGGAEEEDPAEKKRTMAEVLENREGHLKRQAEKQAKTDDPSQILRRLFESITDGPEASVESESFLPEPEPASPKPPPLKKTPPPLPKAGGKTQSAAESLSPAEKKALANLHSRGHSPRRKKHRPLSIRAMTRGRGLRQAVVLKEILDPPRSLRPY